MPDQPEPDVNERLAGTGRVIYTAGVLALTEPGPAATGLVVRDDRGRPLARRSQYIGQARRDHAAARALLWGLELARWNQMESPTVFTDDAPLYEWLTGGSPPAGLDELLAKDLPRAVAELPGLKLKMMSATTNPARPLALAPLVDWLPERARRGEDLSVRALPEHRYEVTSERDPNVVYHVVLPDADHSPGEAVMQCECADFQFRGIPCKHLLAAARIAGREERVFYPHP